MLWNLTNLGPNQYTTIIAMINAEDNQETVGSGANRLRYYESMVNGPMHAHISAVVKDLEEEFKEEIREVREEKILPVEEEQYVPIVTLTVHCWQYQMNQDAMIPIHKTICELESQVVFSKVHSPSTVPFGLYASLTENGN
ncbi:hypothetical protein HGM15179_018917 [Zosterops borbonicus]|uniref:Uncharacterized protein n=1 Tax=Zosterops borbonicus TaxID=364589 RepID=A0A8K1DAU1_9PASS|nr:hypothetical protein HGM15179_018917 [Zosterops borbonicus]